MRLQVPGWGGEATQETFQPWHWRQFEDASNLAVDLSFPCASTTVSRKRCQSPFQQLSADYFAIKADIELKVPPEHALLILPHYRFFTDQSCLAPFVVPLVWQGWWPGPWQVLFRFRGRTVFRPSEPYAQAMVLRMEPPEIRDRQEPRDALHQEQERHITRRWVNSFGYEDDNLYNVLAQLAEVEQLPACLVRPPAKQRLIRCRHGPRLRSNPTAAGKVTTSEIAAPPSLWKS